ncbi:MAG: 16S rRNA (uracil(1498)-N(3))-methyltransferase [Candidatus Leucobacter sulfamidivorax]|nr:16S rRNA (uracil(1498)-N(3))-methyltransferase [Candidatus Leucobacter sulfamidivorax]
MANLYYREDLPASAFEVGATVEVTGEEARHAVRVARLRVGERIMVGDGAGAIGIGEVTAADRDRFAVRLTEARRDPVPARPLVLVQALAKGDRDERAVEQATEFGVDLVMPWQAARSVSRWDGADKAARGAKKWRRIAREASKQALRSRAPVVTPPVSLDEVRGFARAGAEVLVLHPAGADALSDYTPSPVRSDAVPGDPVGGVLVVVGPEGGIDDAELEALAAAGARVLRLGETVLRTSSAGPAALAVLNVALGRW